MNLSWPVFIVFCIFVAQRSRLNPPLCNLLQGQPANRPLEIGVGASKMSPNTKGGKKQAAPTKLFRYLCRGVLRGSGGTQHMPVRLRNLNEYRTTICCSKCGERTTAPYVTDYRTHRRREATRLRECPACKQRLEQGFGEGAVGARGGNQGVGRRGD